jgi:hypothetical protein
MKAFFFLAVLLCSTKKSSKFKIIETMEKDLKNIRDNSDKDIRKEFYLDKIDKVQDCKRIYGSPPYKTENSNNQ